MIRPDFREIKAIANSDNELLHYGVKGMRWRFHKRRENDLDRFKRKEEKLAKKFNKFDTKMTKKQDIANKKYQKAVNKSSGFFASQKSSSKAFKKATAAQRKVNRISYKGSQKFKRYEKLAKKLDVPMDENLKKRGLAYLDDVIANSKTAYQVALSKTF